MQINGPTQVHGAQPINKPHAIRSAQPVAQPEPAAINDQLDLSEQGQMVSRVHELPDVRQARVDEIRAAIAGGKYETDEKLNTAVERLLDEIG